MDENVKRAWQKGAPQRVKGQQSGKKKYGYSSYGAKDGHVIQKEGDRTPEQGIAKAGELHDRGGRNAHREVHRGDGDKIAGDIMFDLLRNADRLQFVLVSRQDFNNMAKERVAEDQQKKQNEHGRE